MSFTFDLHKVIQEVGVLLGCAPSSRFNFMLILKLLYLADRQSLRDIGTLMSGDDTYAMNKGPVLSKTYDLMKKENHSGLGSSEEDKGFWNKYFETVGHDLKMIEQTDTDLLSDYEVEVLQGLFEKWNGKKDKLLNSVGELPEVKKRKRGNSSTYIPLREIVKAVGRDESWEEIKQSMIEDEFIKTILGS